jgi:hypothetical protein
MPIILGVDHEQNEVDAVAIGLVSFEDVTNHLSIERKSGGLSYKKFIDARGACLNWTPEEVPRIVELIQTLGRGSKLGPTAVLVSSEIDFGMVRTLELLLEYTAAVRPFLVEQEARAWLAERET